MAVTRHFLPRLSSTSIRRDPAQLQRLAPLRNLQTSSSRSATPLPITAHGPPPQPPLPALSQISQFRAQQKADALRTKKFWKEVNVVKTPAGLTINLDTRPLKTPEKAVLLIPNSKPLLAHGIALEWSHLRSAADAQKSHHIPLTQMASRAIDMAAAEKQDDFQSRSDAMLNLIRYLDTDTVLCWAPTTPEHLREPGRPQLRDQQIASAKPLLGYLSTRVWPGLNIWVLDGDVVGISGRGQTAETRETLLGWMRALDVWKFVGFERAVHATKSFVIGARMVEEWSRHGGGKWGVMEAAEAASIEVAFQTRQWGEVEDTHDVEKEDLRRQLGAGWLMIVGEV